MKVREVETSQPGAPCRWMLCCMAGVVVMPGGPPAPAPVGVGACEWLLLLLAGCHVM